MTRLQLLTARRLWFLGFIGLVPLPGVTVHRWLMLLFLAPLVSDLAGAWRAGSAAGDRPETVDELPEPARAGGVWLFATRFHLATALSLLNPYLLAESFRQTRGEVAAAKRARALGPVHPTRIRYRLPVRGEWLITNGGKDRATSHSWDVPAQRFAYDLVRVGPDGRSHDGAGDRVEDYLCYGEPVVAAADGVVVGVADGLRDAPGVGTGWVDWKTRSVAGNAVTVRHADNEYSFYAHLIGHRIPVAVGDAVSAGEVVGYCGHSGHSTEPHLHFQVQDTPDFRAALGLPIRFRDVQVSGVEETSPATLTRSMKIASRV